MIKVIEHGYAKYECNCHQCGCWFEYELEDIKDGSVKCPDCGHLCIHNSALNTKRLFPYKRGETMKFETQPFDTETKVKQDCYKEVE